MNAISLRRLTGGDLPAADQLRELAGWNQVLDDWRRLLGLEPDGCFAAVLDGELVGTVTTTTYGRALAWIGMMLVHPDCRRRGISTHLMRQALAYLQGQGVPCIRLDATPAGRPLYEKLGFVAEWTLTRSERAVKKATRVPVSGLAAVRELRDSDWPAVDEIDTGGFGAPRPRLLRSLAQQSRRVLVCPAQGRLVGWGMLRPGVKADYLGPLACASAEGAWALVATLLSAAPDRPVVWDVPDQNEAAVALARRFDFSPLRPLTRMRLGPDSVVNGPRAQFAIADPAVG